MEVGDKVKIKSNASCPEMDEYVGCIARITKLTTNSMVDACMLDVDCGEWRWYLSDLELVTDGSGKVRYASLDVVEVCILTKLLTGGSAYSIVKKEFERLRNGG